MNTPLLILALAVLIPLGAYVGLGGSLGHPLRAIARMLPFGR